MEDGSPEPSPRAARGIPQSTWETPPHLDRSSRGGEGVQFALPIFKSLSSIIQDHPVAKLPGVGALPQFEQVALDIGTSMKPPLTSKPIGSEQSSLHQIIEL